MDDGSAINRSADGRRSAPEEVWDAVREDYLGGLSGPECCRRHGVGLTSLRKRAAVEGWRRADQPWRIATDPDLDDEGRMLEDDVCGDVDQITPRQLCWMAERRMVRAVLRGDAAGALRWRRVRLAMQLEEAELQRWIDEESWAEHRTDAAREARSPSETATAVNASHCNFRPRESADADLSSIGVTAPTPEPYGTSPRADGLSGPPSTHGSPT